MRFNLISIALILMLLSSGVFALSRAEIKSNHLNKSFVQIVGETVNNVVASVSKTMSSASKHLLKTNSTHKASSKSSNRKKYQPYVLKPRYPGNHLPYVFSTLITYENKVYRGVPFTIRSHLYSRKNQSLALTLGLFVCDLSSNPTCEHDELIPAYYYDSYYHTFVEANGSYYWPALNNRIYMHKGDLETIDTSVVYNGPLPPEGYKVILCGAISNDWFFWPQHPVKKFDYKCRELPLRG